jgi:hypothetical protein
VTQQPPACGPAIHADRVTFFGSVPRVGCESGVRGCPLLPDASSDRWGVVQPQIQIGSQIIVAKGFGRLPVGSQRRRSAGSLAPCNR